MKPKIKSLLAQAHLEVENIKDTNAIAERFAELIIEQCIGIVENLSPGYKDYRDQIEDAFRRDCIEEMKNFWGDPNG